jgi:hypothetical protein
MQEVFSFIFTHKTIDFIDSNRPAQQLHGANESRAGRFVANSGVIFAALTAHAGRSLSAVASSHAPFADEGLVRRPGKHAPFPGSMRACELGRF